MTAAELASFRTLLQAQAVPPRRPDAGLFARMRSKLVLVDRVDPPAEAAPQAQPAPVAPEAEPVGLTWDEVLAPTAPPPPRSPPAFGRREAEAAAGTAPASAPEPADAPLVVEAESVVLRRRPLTPEVFSTPDEEPPRAAPATPAPGVIAGWSRARPPSAQRRILTRLEAVFLAERQGLDARLAAAHEPARS